VDIGWWRKQGGGGGNGEGGRTAAEGGRMGEVAALEVEERGREVSFRETVNERAAPTLRRGAELDVVATAKGK
jgi:hypothetical protein